MTTEIIHEFEIDGDFGLNLKFDLAAEGSPEIGWRITEAVLLEMTVYLDLDQGEETQTICSDRLEWLNRRLVTDDILRGQIEDKLTAQWDRDHEDDAVYASPSWQRAVALGVD
ncbi:MAG TPA: hypothetical protein VM165_08995 [Planctomycetaceae bacterium]|nr:hypothetical protein [Planctomycetaceae bacterium]